MATIIGLVVLVLIGLWIKELFVEFGGAWGRWRNGEPIRLSEYLGKQYAEKSRLRELRKTELYGQYRAAPDRINDYYFYREFKEYWDWQVVRGVVLSKARESGQLSCAACSSTIKWTKRIHIDHIKPRSKYPELRYLISNLQILCDRCNRAKHAYDGDDWRDVTLNRRKQQKARKAKARKKKVSQTLD